MLPRFPANRGAPQVQIVTVVQQQEVLAGTGAAFGITLGVGLCLVSQLLHARRQQRLLKLDQRVED
jgi:hypothetical protein